MAGLPNVLETYVGNGSVPGAVGLVARGDRAEVALVGSVAVGGVSMARDSIFRLASITKPITAAAVMMLVDDGRIALDSPVGQWLPELAEPKVVRTPTSAVDDVLPAVRAITVVDLLSSRAGYGFASDFTLPALQRLFSVQKDGREPQSLPAPDVWMAELARIPLLYQPGEAWLYDACSTLQGVLITRVSGQSLPDFLAERVFEPLGMADAGFEVPDAKRDRFTSYYRTSPAGGLELADGPDGQWSTRPTFPLGNGGLVGTADDWLAFGRILLAEGTAADIAVQWDLKSVSRTRSTPFVRIVRKLPMTWSPVTESNRRPSPYHAYQSCSTPSRWVGLVQVGEISASECVALRLPLPEAVVTWFVTDQDGPRSPERRAAPRFRDGWVGTVSSDQGLVLLGAA